MLDPKRHPVISGANGLRKCRFAKASGGRGKSGSYRIAYAYFEEFGVIVAIAVFAKKDQDNLTGEQKRQITSLLDRLYNWIKAGG